MDVVLVEICSEFLLNTHAVECLLIYLEFLAKMHIAKIPLSILHIFVAVNLNIHVYVPISMYLQNYTRNTHTKKRIYQATDLGKSVFPVVILDIMVLYDNSTDCLRNCKNC